MPRPKTKAPAAPTAFSVAVARNPARKDLQVVLRGLNRFNRDAVGDARYAHFLVEARSPRGKLVGGLQGFVYFGWLFVANLWLMGQVRRGGLGTRLLAAAERHAQSLGCHGVWLDTFGWQARPFYEKRGYRLFGSLPDYPTGHPRWFLMKRIAPAKAGATSRRRPPARRTQSRRA